MSGERGSMANPFVVGLCIKHALRDIELAILSTPSGPFRNKLTEVNILLMSIDSDMAVTRLSESESLFRFVTPEGKRSIPLSGDEIIHLFPSLPALPEGKDTIEHEGHSITRCWMLDRKYWKDAT